MAKTAHNDVFDAALDKIATANKMIACSAQPTTRTEAITTYALSDVTMTPGDGNGDFTIADNGSDGRKLTIAAQLDIDVDAAGGAAYIALVDSTDLLFVTTGNSLSVEAGEIISFPAWEIRLLDPDDVL